MLQFDTVVNFTSCYLAHFQTNMTDESFVKIFGFNTLVLNIALNIKKIQKTKSETVNPVPNPKYKAKK